MNSRPVAEHHEHDLPPDAELPQPVQSRSRWPGRLVWLVPVLAAAAAAYYVYEFYQQRGMEIAITFDNVSQLKIRDTPLTYHGVRVGSVSAIELNADRTRASVHVRIERAYEQTIARDGGTFWLVRPDLGGGGISGLSTVITGPYIDCQPGAGDPVYQFAGFDKRPVLLGDGIRVVLQTTRLGHLQIDSPVYFRGMQVGAVQDIRLSSDATGVNVTAFVWQRYAKLLRRSSRFWLVSGTDIHGGVLNGISLKVNNLQALLAGGVAFATPDGDAESAGDGHLFTLHDEAKEEWLDWSAKIALPTDESPQTPTTSMPPAK